MPLHKRTFSYKANWYGEIISGYTKSDSAYAAERNSILQIAKKVGRTAYAVREYILDKKHDRFEIKEVLTAYENPTKSKEIG